MQEIRPGVHVEVRGAIGCNSVVIETGEGLVLVDAPWPYQAMAQRAWIDNLGDTAKYLIYTDHHADHVTGSPWFPGTVVAHAGTYAELLAGPPDFVVRGLARFDPDGLTWLQDNGWPVRLPEITFTKRMGLHIGGRTIELLHLPGHTANTTAVYLANERVLITGDNMVNLGGPPGMADCCIIEQFATFDAIARLDYDVLVPGHGPITDPAGLGSYRAMIGDLVSRVEAATETERSLSGVLERVSYPDHHHLGNEEHPGYEAPDVAKMNRDGVTRIYEEIVRAGGKRPWATNP